MPTEFHDWCPVGIYWFAQTVSGSSSKATKLSQVSWQHRCLHFTNMQLLLTPIHWMTTCDKKGKMIALQSLRTITAGAQVFLGTGLPKLWSINSNHEWTTWPTLATYSLYQNSSELKTIDEIKKFSWEASKRAILLSLEMGSLWNSAMLNFVLLSVQP